MKYRILLIFVVFFSISVFAQTETELLLLKNKKFYTYTPVNVGATASTDQIIFSGASVKYPSNRIDGSSRAYQPWMRWWIDSTDVVVNGTFDSDSTYWDSYVQNDTLEWVASYGGLTGALHFTSIDDEYWGGVEQDSLTLSPVLYNLKADFYIDSSIHTTALIAYIYSNNIGFIGLINIPTPLHGSYSLDTTFTNSNAGASDCKLRIVKRGIYRNDYMSVYIDNISLIPVADSVSGYTKLLSSVAEDIPYYYSQSGRYITKTDTIWAAAAVDTVYSFINTPILESANGLEKAIAVVWLDRSNSEIGHEVSYALVSSGDWSVFDTSAIDAATMTITGLLDTTEYKVRVRTIGDYVNSGYSNMLTAITDYADSCETPDIITVLSAVGSPTNITLTWTDVVCDSVFIYKDTDTENPPTIFLTAVDSGVGTYIDTVVVQGTVYFYRLKAYENVCQILGAYSAMISDTVNVTDETPPSVPTNVLALNIRTSGAAPPDTIPALTAFTPVTGAALSSYHISNGSVLSNVDSCWASAAGDSFRVNFDGILDVISVKVYNTDTIFVTKIASGSYSTAVTTTITAGGVQRTFSVTTLSDPAYAGTIWYVDRDATGTNNGTSWTDAWTDMDAWGYSAAGGVNWTLISASDTIYISGGTDSTTYTPDGIYGHTMIYSNSRNYTFAPGNPVVIAPAWHPNHNGDVIFSTNTTYNAYRAVFVKRLSNLKFINLTFKNEQDVHFEYGGVIIVGDGNAWLDSLITFENCHFIGNGGQVFGVSTAKLTLRNCIIESLQNSYPNDQDLLAGGYGRGGHIVDNCKFIYRNSYESILDVNITDGEGMTATDTSITDTDLNATPMVPGYHINNSVWVGGYYLQLTDNTTNTFISSNGWKFEPVNRTSAVTTTSTSFFHDAENFATNGFVNTYLICEGDTLVITSNTGYFFYGTGGWSSGGSGPSPTVSTKSWQVVGGELPGDGTAWVMGGAHRDMVQLSLLGDTTTGSWNTNIFSNNLFIDDSELGTGWNAMIYHVGAYNSRFIYYNNIIVQRKINTSSSAFFMRDDSGTAPFFQSGVFLNNTIIVKGKNVGVFTVNFDTVITRNNLVVIDTSSVSNNVLFYSTKSFDQTTLNLNYNYFAKLGGADVGYFTPGDTYAQWQARGFDLNSYTDNSTNVIFANKYGLEKADYYTTSGRDLGVDLSATYPFLAYDALGNPRSGSWDIGALEYQGGGQGDETPPSPPTNVDAENIRTAAGSGDTTLFRDAIFLHRSTGAEIYGQEGSTTDVPAEVLAYNTVNGYTGKDTVNMEEDPFPVVLTNNAWWNWRDLFFKTHSTDDIYPYIEGTTYDIIIIKTCYTYSGLWFWWYEGPQDTVNYPFTHSIYNYQNYVRGVVEVMGQHPEKFFVLWNLAPLQEGQTTIDDAFRDHSFSTWMTDTLAAGLDAIYGAFPPNVFVFDYFHKLVDTNYYLRPEYGDSPSDDHPSPAATDLIAPLFVKEVFDAAIAYELIYNGGGMLPTLWKRIEPYFRNNETNFWRGQK